MNHRSVLWALCLLLLVVRGSAAEPAALEPPKASGYATGGLAQRLQRLGVRPLPQWLVWSGRVAVFVGTIDSSKTEGEAEQIALRVTRVLGSAPDGVRLEAGQVIPFAVVPGSAGAAGAERIWLLGLSDAMIIGFESYPLTIEAELVEQLAARPAVVLQYRVSGGIEGRMDNLVVFADGAVIDRYGGEVSGVTRLRPAEQAELDELRAKYRAIGQSHSDGEGVADGMGSALVFAGTGEGNGAGAVTQFGERLFGRLAQCREAWSNPTAPADATPAQQEEHRRALEEKAQTTTRE